jgi:hypothetical protein
MEDAQSSARAALLKTWMSETQLIAFRRDRNAVEEYPLPPAGLTSEDSAAAGFKFHDQGCARCGSKAIFQLNFSPDLKHQTMFFHGPERRRTALLWMDGQPIPVPADREGNPAAETLGAVAGRTLFERLLDQCGKSRT